jgi:diguanylate cyclase (GGDEF)-like protein
VGIAGVCADVFVDESPAASIAVIRQYFKDRHQMAEAECDALLDEIGRSTREIASLFEINIGSGSSFEDILKKANEALVAITLESQQQTNSLLEQNQQLRKEAWTDALTGLANRGRFDQFFADQFADALKMGQPLALLLMDVDRFKSVNDKHGHPAGDKVLVALGKLVGSAARSTDLAARYGGEEIVLVLPRTNRAIAATIAESIRRAIAANPIPVGTAELPITASIGVALAEPGSPFTQPAHLLKAADMAVYAAKHGGRNCVKVFSLKSQAPKSAA